MPVHVSGFVGIAGGRGLALQAAQGETEEQSVTISGSSVASSAFNVATKVVRVHTTAVCHVKINSNPTATTASMRMAADQTEYFGVNGGSDKIAVIQGT